MKIKILAYCIISSFLILSSCSSDEEPIDNPTIVGPKNLELTPINGSSFNMSWTNDNASSQEELLIERKEKNMGDFVQIKTVDPSLLTYTDTGLNGETQYVYRLRAKEGSTFSTYSNEATATTFKQVPNGEFLVLNTQFKGGSTGSKTNTSRSLAYSNNTAELGTFGGWKDVQLQATGKFRTEKYNDTWYIVDPEGYLYFGMACNSVYAESEYSSVDLPKDLKEVGFNHLGNWSDYAAINSGSEKIPYTFRELFMQGYKNTSQRTKDFWSEDGIIAVFDPEFLPFADDLAQVVANRKDDPYCIGVFSDNEMPIYSNSTYGDLLERYLNILDKTDPNYLAADAWMTARKGANYAVTEQDDLDWHGKVASTYYEIVHTAIKKYAPDMLYLGSRLHGAAKSKNAIFKDSAPFIDVFSVNYYGTYDPSDDLNMWEQESNKPFIISEFYGKGFDVNLSNSTGAGYHVPTQKDRALYFENIAIRFLESKGCVGYQWHKFQDDNSNRGLINKDEKWYPEMSDALIKINKDIYNFRTYLRSN